MMTLERNRQTDSPPPFQSRHRPAEESDADAFDRVNDFLRDFAGFTSIQLHFVHEAIERAGLELVSPHSAERCATPDTGTTPLPAGASRINWIEIHARIRHYYDDEPGYPQPCENCQDGCECPQCQAWSECDSRYDRAWKLYHIVHEPWIDTQVPVKVKNIPQTDEELAAEFSRLLQVPLESITEDA